jgi:hypothetical protein
MILGGAAVHRCDKCIASNTDLLTTEGKALLHYFDGLGGFSTRMSTWSSSSMPLGNLPISMPG